MSCNWFYYILIDTCFTNAEVPYEVGFFYMRQLEEAWNDNMDQMFLPSWINLLDESMMEWFNKWDYEFMCVGRKQHPFRNDRNTIGCAPKYILWSAHIVEGKDRPTKLDTKEWEDLGKTVGIMLQMCETIFLTG